MLNYTKLLKNAKEEEIMKALIKIIEMKNIEDIYQNAAFWYPEQRGRKQKEKISFVINDNIFSYEYNYKEGIFNCHFSKSVKCNHSRITMKDIDTLERILFTYINENVL